MSHNNKERELLETAELYKYALELQCHRIVLKKVWQ
jgi:hypothetical protein